MDYEKIPAEQFAFVHENEKLHDAELQTKARGFFADAMLRFRKNKSSVVAAYILLFLVLYAIFAPMISIYDVNDTDAMYVNYPPFVPSMAHTPILNGARVMDSQNDKAMQMWSAIAEETGYNPVIRTVNTYTTEQRSRGQTITRYTYDIEVNMYYAKGIVYRNFNYADYQRLQEWQNETGIQVIFPYVEPDDIGGITDNPNIWYQVDSSGNAVLDEDGNFIPAYSTLAERAGAPYDSIRVDGDDGSWVYSSARAGSVQCRVLYYNYYQYLNGHEPSYIMGTNVMGMDLFCAIGLGARFSLIFALMVS